MEDKRTNVLLAVLRCPVSYECTECDHSCLVRSFNRGDVLVCNFPKGCDGVINSRRLPNVL